MMLDDIKADETVEPWIENIGETECLELAFKQNTNDDESRGN